MGCKKNNRKSNADCEWRHKLVARNGTTCDGYYKCAFERCVDPILIEHQVYREGDEWEAGREPGSRGGEEISGSGAYGNIKDLKGERPEEESSSGERLDEEDESMGDKSEEESANEGGREEEGNKGSLEKASGDNDGAKGSDDEDSKVGAMVLSGRNEDGGSGLDS